MDIPLKLDWTSLAGLLALAQALLLCLYLSSFYVKKPEAWLLTGFLGSIIIALGHDILLHSRLALYLPQIIGFGPFSTYLSGPLILFVVVRLLWPQRQFKWYDALHLLPFILHFTSRAAKYFGASEPKLSFLQGYYQSAEQSISHQPFSLEAIFNLLYFYGHRFIYIGIALYLLIRFKANVSHALLPRQRFYQMLLAGLTAYCAGWLLLRSLKFISNIHPDLMINSIALAVAVIALALMVFHYPFNEIFSSKSTQKYQQSPMDDDISKQIVESLDALLTQDRLFCDNQLKQSSVAEKSGFSTQQISQALNSQGVTFNDFLNQYRLVDIKQQLLKPENAKADIQQLALDSGFNSKATFYRVFKEKVGMTPCEFRKQQD